MYNYDLDVGEECNPELSAFEFDRLPPWVQNAIEKWAVENHIDLVLTVAAYRGPRFLGVLKFAPMKGNPPAGDVVWVDQERQQSTKPLGLALLGGGLRRTTVTEQLSSPK